MSEAASLLLDVWVPGRPVPQGSMRAPAAGVLVPASPKLASWRRSVHLVCQAAWRRPGPVAGPVSVELGFVLPRPRKPEHPSPISHRSGDLDKLIRAIFDGIQDARIVVDDAQVVSVSAGKRYGGEPGCAVRILA